MTFSFRPAVRERVGLLIALAGASGSGKTFSALQLAKGLANGHGKIAVIDTEAGRAKHYADQFQFLHGDMTPPFTPERYIEAIQAAESAGATVVVIDSASHEWAGDGGIQDIHTEIVQRMATDKQTGEVDARKLESLSAPAWREPKMRHKRMVSRLLQSRAHLIFCLRAEDKVKFRTVEEEGRNGRIYKKTVIEPAGWQPICEKHFMFEMTLSFTLAPDSPGVPRFDLPHKLQEQHRAFFPEKRFIGPDAGRQLGLWAAGDTASQASPMPAEPGGPPVHPAPPAGGPSQDIELDRLRKAASEVADLGTEQLARWFGGLTREAKALIKPYLEHYKAIASNPALQPLPIEEPPDDMFAPPPGDEPADRSAAVGA